MGNVEAAASPPREKAAGRVWARVDVTSWLESLRFTTASRVALMIVAFAGTWYLSGDTNGRSTVGILDMWHRWDAVHFTDIATYGYFAPETDPNAAAFFPLLPLLIDMLMKIGFEPRFAGMFISFIASVVAGAYLYRLAETDVGEGGGRRAVGYLFLFPTAVFLIAGYTEALFLAGAIPAFYYARQGRWQLVALPAAVAMGSRLAGLFLLIGLAVEFIRQKDFSLTRMSGALFAGAVGLLPLLLYGVFLQNATGNFLEFKDAQYRGWGRMVVSPVASFTTTWNTWFGDYTTNWLFAWRVEILAALVGLVFVVWAFWRREWGYGAYMLATMVVLMTSTWYFSIPRMLLSLFPIVILLAHYTHDNPARHQSVLMAMGPLAALGVIVFTRGNWFY